MKKRVFYLIIILFSLIYITNSSMIFKKNVDENKKLNYSAELDVLKRTYSNIILLKAIYCLDENNILFSPSKDINGDYMLFEKFIIDKLKKHPNVIDSLYLKYQKMSHNEAFCDKVENWCYTYILITSPLSYEMPVFFDEIIYEIPITKHLVRSFFKIKQQDWASLSSSQQAELPYKVCNFISKTNKDDKLLFFRSFFDFIKKRI